MWEYHNSNLCIATNGQRSRVCGKLFLSSVVPLHQRIGGKRGSIGIGHPNAIAAQRAARFLSNTCQKMRGGKHVKIKKRQRQDTLRFRADARKLILGSIGTPLDHLSIRFLLYVCYTCELLVIPNNPAV